MRNVKGYCLFIIFTLLLTACTAVEKEETASNTKLTIESYSMSNKEKELISKTGVGQIEFFKLDGTLEENDYLQFSVEEFENGQFKRELQHASDGPATNFKDILISFGISGVEEAGPSFKLLTGIPSGLVTTNYSNNMTAYSFNKLVGDKMTLEKNKPAYLAAWVGTTKNSLHSVESETGELPAGIEEAEIALLYKILWTDQEM